MSNNYIPLEYKTTEDEGEKPIISDDIGPALLPQIPEKTPQQIDQKPQDDTPKYGIQATPLIQNDNDNNENKDINNSIELPPKTLKKPHPEGYVKKQVLTYIIFAICIIDILINIIFNIKCVSSLIADITGIIYSIIQLILLYTNIELKGTWIFIFYFSMVMVSGFFGAIGLVQSLSKFIKESSDEVVAIWLFIFIIILFIRVFIPILG
jgi:hypothetical protein